jgi:hypothetical protein
MNLKEWIIKAVGRVQDSLGEEKTLLPNLHRNPEQNFELPTVSPGFCLDL